MFLICDNCPCGIRVVGVREDIEVLVGRGSPHYGNYKCPQCNLLMVSAEHVGGEVLNRKQVRDLSPQEAHLAFEGLGFPSERDCVHDIVAQELTTKAVKRVKGKTVPGTNRSSIDELELEDGTTIFLSGSAHGALVYRIRKPQPYVEAAS